MAQDVFLVLVEKLPSFAYDPKKSFRAWLRTVTLNKWRENARRAAGAPRAAGGADLPDPVFTKDSDTFAQCEYRRQLVRQAMKIIQVEYDPAVWRACWEYMVAGRPAAEVAAEFTMTRNALYLAKSRMLRRLRVELEGLLD